MCCVVHAPGLCMCPAARGGGCALGRALCSTRVSIVTRMSACGRLFAHASPLHLPTHTHKPHAHTHKPHAHTQVVDISDKEKALWRPVSVPTWFTADVKLGQLALHLDPPGCFAAESYAREWVWWLSCFYQRQQDQASWRCTWTPGATRLLCSRVLCT